MLYPDKLLNVRTKAYSHAFKASECLPPTDPRGKQSMSKFS